MKARPWPAKQGVPQTGARSQDRRSGRSRFFWATLGGLALTAAFPPIPFGWLAWAALFPLLWAIEGLPAYRAFRIGLWAGFVHYLALIYWILFVLGHYGGLHPLLATPPLLLLCLYLALYPAFFCWAFTPLSRTAGAPFWGAGLWAVLELLRGHLLTGFPWCPLGVTQFKNLPMIQFVEVAGVGGISFLIVFVNIGLYRALVRPIRGHFPRRLIYLSLCIGLSMASMFYGLSRLKEITHSSASTESPVPIAIVQGNVDQSLKWNAAYQERTLERYQRLTLQAEGLAPNLVVWPETAVPFFFEPDNGNGLSARVAETASMSGAAILFGSPAYQRDEGGSTNYFNRAYLVSPDGDILGHYDKMHLVPFGEYVPLKKLLFFIQRLVPAAGDFTEGERTDPLRYKEFSLGVLICFEAVFPELARQSVRTGANVLVNITNDAWFGHSSAPYQHLAMAVFRAVENRVPLLRSANTGISAFIDPSGRLLQTSPLFEQALLTEQIAVPREAPSTVYNRWGDIWIVVLGLLVLLRLCWVVLRRSPKESFRGL